MFIVLTSKKKFAKCHKSIFLNYDNFYNSKRLYTAKTSSFEENHRVWKKNYYQICGRFKNMMGLFRSWKQIIQFLRILVFSYSLLRSVITIILLPPLLYITSQLCYFWSKLVSPSCKRSHAKEQLGVLLHRLEQLKVLLMVCINNSL